MLTEKSKSSSECKEWIRMVGLGPIGWTGVAVAWSLQKGYGTTVLLQLGLAKSAISVIWLAGPISGILIQPLVGSCSDYCHSRMPFIVFGCILIMFNLYIFSQTQHIGIAKLIFWSTDFCINILMVGLRAISTDHIDASKQMDAMSWFSIFGSFGSWIIFFISSHTDDISLSYSIGSAIICCSTLITLCMHLLYSPSSTPLTPAQTQKPTESTRRTNCNFLTRICVTWNNLPWFIWKIMHVQFWSFAAFYPMWVYIPTFYSENIMHGEINEEENSWKYGMWQRGLSYSNFAYSWNSLIMVAASFLIPKVFRNEHAFCTKLFWMSSYVFCAVFLLITPWVNQEKHLSAFMVMHALCGVTSAVMEIFPWQITSRYTTEYDSDNKALVLTIVNLAVCVSQIFVAIISGKILTYYHGNVASVLFFAGICKLIAAVCVLFVDLEYKQKRSSD